MGESQHDKSNSMVKAEQGKVKNLACKMPEMEDRYMKFDACMMNNGVHAQEFAKSLTRGIDHEAFPVRQFVDESQD